jgi:FAD/FMN-containing dehydrogenase
MYYTIDKGYFILAAFLEVYYAKLSYKIERGVIIMDVHKLVSTLKGQVLFPEDAEYDEVRQVFYGGIDKKPTAIVQVADAEDVKKVILFAKEQGLELAVRSGGHSVAGYSSTDGGVVIDLRDMRNIQIDTADRTVWAETGLTAGELTSELDKHNFVLGFGDTGSVGIGGITLGGGVGFLARKFGLAIDNLLAAEIVTADGKILQVDESNHLDLFWAIRGGGGNFGVVTKFKYQLHELRDCYGGMLFLPATPKVISGIAELAAVAPDEMSAIVNVMPTFPMPFIPKEHYGKLSIMAMMVYAGDPKDGEKALAPFRALAEPLADMLKPMRYKDIFLPEPDNYHPTAVSHNMHVNTIDRAVATEILNWLDKLEAPMKALQFRVLGGAVAKVPEDATAYAHRKNAVMVNIAAFYETAEEKALRQKWIDDFAAALFQGDAAGYVGFLGPTEQGRLTDAYPPETLKKLREVKNIYDPENVFRLNFNISPFSV